MTAPYPDTSEVPGGLLAPEPAVRTGALIGYARVSTSGQLLDRQQHALAEAGCLRVFADKLSGKNSDRPELAACLDYLRARRHPGRAGPGPVLAATVFAHESAAFGVHVLAGVGGDVRPGCRAGAGSGCAEEAGERGDGFEQQGVEAGLLVGGAADAELGDGAAVLGLGGELADPGGHGGVFEGGRAAGRGLASRG